MKTNCRLLNGPSATDLRDELGYKVSIIIIGAIIRSPPKERSPGTRLLCSEKRTPPSENRDNIRRLIRTSRQQQGTKTGRIKTRLIWHPVE